MQTSLAKTDLQEHPPLRALRSKAGDCRMDILNFFLGNFELINDKSFFFFFFGGGGGGWG